MYVSEVALHMLDGTTLEYIGPLKPWATELAHYDAKLFYAILIFVKVRLFALCKYV